MSEVFLDTSGWFAAIRPKEAHHEAAFHVYRQWIAGGARMVTTNLVVTEMQVMLTKFRGVDAGVRFLDGLYQDPLHEVVFVDRELHRAATDRWLRKFTDLDLSLTDAVSFEVMRVRRISEALTLDSHFRIAGFSPVP